MPKHLKIISNDKIVFEGEINTCSDCPIRDDGDSGFLIICHLLEHQREVSPGDIQNDCPLEDKVN